MKGRAAVALAMVMACVGCIGSPQTPTASPTPTIDWLSMSAEDMAQDWQADAANARGRFLDRDVRVDGVVTSVVKPYPGPELVVLRGTDSMGVGCHSTSAGPGNRLWDVGDHITLVGVGRAPTSVTYLVGYAAGTPVLDTHRYVALDSCLAVPEGGELPSARPSPQPTP